MPLQHFEYLEPYHSTNIMSRSRRSVGSSRKGQSSDSNPSFYANTSDAIFARDKMTEEPFRYFQNVSYLKKNAEVTDALRAAHPRLAVYDRNSMKGGISRMLKSDQEVIDKITRFFNANGGPTTTSCRWDGSTNHGEEQEGLENSNINEPPVSEARE